MSDILIKEVIRLRWRSKKWLLALLFLELISILTLIATGVDYKILSILPVTYIIWLVVNYYDVLLPHHKMAISLEADYDNKDGVSRARRIVDKIESYFNANNLNSKLIKVYPLDINRFKSVDSAKNYLGSWYNKFDSIILAEIDYGQTDSRNIFIIKKLSIISKYLSYEVNLKGTLINLREDLKIIGTSTKFKYLIEDELRGRDLVISSLNNLLLYYSGLCLICQRRIDDSLLIFKSIYNPNKTKIELTKPLPKKLRLTPEQIFHARIKTLLIAIFKQMVAPVQYKLGDSAKLKILNEAIETLSPAPIIYDFKILLARTQYEMNDRVSAEKTTEEVFEEFGLADEILLNRGFFAILNDSPSKVLKNYKQLKNLHCVDCISVIGFLYDEMEKHPKSRPLFEFAIAILTFLYKDRTEGRELLRGYISATHNIVRLRPLREYCMQMIKK